VVGQISLTPTAVAIIAGASKKIIIGSTITIPLDENGELDFIVPATDDPDTNPTGWTYTVVEDFPGGRTYSIDAPQNSTRDLSSIVPVSSAAGLAITRGQSAYELAVSEGFVGTESEWITSLHGAGALDASSTIKGVIQLTGDLGGTATAPTVPALADKVNRADLAANVKDYGAVGDGVTDDTTAIQDCIAANDHVIIPKGTFLVEAGVLAINGRTGFRLDMVGRLKRKAASARASTLIVYNSSDVKISRFNSDGNVANNNYSGLPVDEAKHCLRVDGSTDVEIGQVDSINPAGDALYVTGATARLTIGTVKSRSDAATGRNTCSIVSGANIKIESVVNYGTGHSTMPGGFDIEPNSGQTVSDVQVGKVQTTSASTGGFTVLGAYTVGGVRQINRVKVGQVNVVKTGSNGGCDVPISGVVDLTVDKISITQAATSTAQAFSIDDCDSVDLYIDAPTSRGATPPNIGATALVTNLRLRGRVGQSGSHCLNIWNLTDSDIDMKLKSPTSGVLVVKQATGVDSTNVRLGGDWRRVSGAAAVQANGVVEWQVDADVTGWTAAQRAIGTYASGAKFKQEIYYGTGTTDQTTAVNNYLAQSSPLGVKKLVGPITVSDLLTAPANTYVDASSATITQTGTSKTTLKLNAGCTLQGGTFIGKGTDYVAGGSPVAIGIDVGITTGGFTTGVQIRNVTLQNFSGAAVRGRNTQGLVIAGCTIVGVGTPTITNGDGGSCSGILIDNGAVETVIRDNDISAVCLGVTSGLTVGRMSIVDNLIHDVPGQHGIYIQNGTNVVINSNVVRTCFYNAIKVQLSVSSTADSVGMTITGNVCESAGDTGIVLINTATDLSAAKKFRGVTVSGNTASNCLRGFYFASVQGGVFANLTAYNSTTDAFTMLDCKNILASNWLADTCGRLGVRLTSTTGSAQDRISFRGVRIKDPAGAGLANNIYGFYLLQGTNVEIDGLVVTSTNTLMQYGLFVAAADSSTYLIRNSYVDNATDYGYRGPAGSSVRVWINNDFNGTLGKHLNAPLNSQNVFTFTTVGTSTWTCPPAAKTVRVTCIGAGGGGGSGRRDADGTTRYGGGGGAAGSRSEIILDGPTYAGTSLTVTVGAGGAGGAAVTADATSGNAGTAGGWSGVGTGSLQANAIVNANGGSGGAGGTAAAGTAGAGVAGTTVGSTGGAGSNGSVAGGLASWSIGTTGGAGGGGGGLTAANVAAAGGGGGFPASGYPAYTGAGAAGANGSNGAAVTLPTQGYGGGGGGASSGGAAGNGGNGSQPGGGGGGGGASVNGTASGAGGAGGNGGVQIIVTY
jgi:hypothetical protein